MQVLLTGPFSLPVELHQPTNPYPILYNNRKYHPGRSLIKRHKGTTAALNLTGTPPNHAMATVDHYDNA